MDKSVDIENVKIDEAREQLQKARKKYCALLIVPMLSLLISGIALIVILGLTDAFFAQKDIEMSHYTYNTGKVYVENPYFVTNVVFEVLTFVSSISVLICVPMYFIKTSNDRKLYKIAKNNEKIRMEERIRARERQRIQEEQNNNNIM